MPPLSCGTKADVPSFRSGDIPMLAERAEKTTPPIVPEKPRAGQSWLSRLRTGVHVALAIAPSWVKVPIYRRVFGFKIARGAQIGVSVLDVRELELQEGSRVEIRPQPPGSNP